MKKNFFVAVYLLIAVCHLLAQERSLYLYQVDPLEKIVKDQNYFQDHRDTIRSARGETATVQLVLKATRDITNIKAQLKSISNANLTLKGSTGWIGYVKAGRNYKNPSRDILRSSSNYFPDPVLMDTMMSLQVLEVTPLWIMIPIPVNAVPGIYKGTVIISGMVNRKKEQYEKDFYLRVYPVTIAKPSLWITNWMNLSPENLAYMNKGKPVDRFSPLYWQLLEQHAEMAGSHAQNMRLMDVLSLTEYSLKDEQYRFDFSHFDEEATLFERAGALERIEGAHLAYRYGSDNFHEALYRVVVPLPDTGQNKNLPLTPYYVKKVNGFCLALLTLEDERTKNFLNQFLPAFKLHLERKGWLGRYVQHIADEPVANNIASYLEISSYIKKYLTDVKIIDAVLTSKQLSGGIDIWVPQLDVLHKDFSFYQEQKSKGSEVWFYTCIMPQGDYANRFIEQPLLQTRYLHWINFKYDISGYLHWALNMWTGFKDPFEDASRDRGKLPAGDSYILYPGYHKLYSSIRFEAMRDGIHDYELLKMLEKKFPDKAREFVNSLVMNFNEYDGNILYFRKIRQEMLELLSL